MKLIVKYNSHTPTTFNLAYAAIEQKEVDLCITMLENAKEADFAMLIRPVLMYGTEEQLTRASKITNPKVADPNVADILVDVTLFEYQLNKLKRGERMPIPVPNKNWGDKEVELKLDNATYPALQKAILTSNLPELMIDFARCYNVDLQQFRNTVATCGSEANVKQFDYLTGLVEPVIDELDL